MPFWMCGIDWVVVQLDSKDAAAAPIVGAPLDQLQRPTDGLGQEAEFQFNDLGWSAHRNRSMSLRSQASLRIEEIFYLLAERVPSCGQRPQPLYAVLGVTECRFE